MSQHNSQVTANKMIKETLASIMMKTFELIIVCEFNSFSFSLFFFFLASLILINTVDGVVIL